MWALLLAVAFASADLDAEVEQRLQQEIADLKQQATTQEAAAAAKIAEAVAAQQKAEDELQDIHTKQQNRAGTCTLECTYVIW